MWYWECCYSEGSGLGAWSAADHYYCGAVCKKGFKTETKAQQAASKHKHFGLSVGTYAYVRVFERKRK